MSRRRLDLRMSPEEIFDDFFANLSVEERTVYRGRLNVDLLPKESVIPVSLLYDIQKMWDGAFANAKKAVDGHAWEGPIRFYYIDADVPNAIAVVHRGQGFIGATLPMLELFWNVAIMLADQSTAVRAAIGLPDVSEDGLRAVMFRLQMNFVIAHEFTHLVHGHVVDRKPSEILMNEILTAREQGNLARQIKEADADAYSLYFVLEHSLNSIERGHDLGLLGIETLPAERQDEVLIRCFVVALAGCLFATQPQRVTATSIYGKRHPPQAARLHVALHVILKWWGEFRSDREPVLDGGRFRQLFRAAALATQTLNGGRDWEEQVQFLSSAEGKDYLAKLFDGLNEFRTSVGK